MEDDAALTTDPPADVARQRRLSAFTAATALTIVVLDQLTKHWAVSTLSDGPITVIDNVLTLRLIRNSGAAFSMVTGMTWILTIVSLTVSVVIIRVSRRLGSRWWALALGLLLGGALGNLMDRFFRAPGFARGHVVDFVELPHWPLFNLADSCICTAAVLIAILGFRGIGLDGRREGA